MRGSMKNACSLMLGFCVGCALYNIMHTTYLNHHRQPMIPISSVQGGLTSQDSIFDDVEDDGRTAPQSMSSIPRIIHQTWHNMDIPVQVCKTKLLSLSKQGPP